MRKEKEVNNLFPVFLKLDNMVVLIVGGGKVGLEKLAALMSNSPLTSITLVAAEICEEIRELSRLHNNIILRERIFLPEDLKDASIVLVAINDPVESRRISNLARKNGKLVNVADKPEDCDFYMSSIVQKGNLKIAISTNGKSPTIAKRLKELFNELLPAELDLVLDNMQQIRNRLKDDFAGKVSKLNRITRDLVDRTGPIN